MASLVAMASTHLQPSLQGLQFLFFFFDLNVFTPVPRLGSLPERPERGRTVAASFGGERSTM